MRRILFQQTDFNSLPNPPAGFNYIGFDGPNFSEKSEDGKINQSVGATGPTGPAGTGGSASSDRLISSNETHNMELVLDNKGTLNIPLMLPVSFTATCDDTHYDGTASFTTSDWWEFEVEFQVSTYGSVAVMMNDIFPILTNPGYVSGYTFRFTEEDHGIPNYNFDIQLNDVQSGTAGWTALLAVGQAPEYPSTIESLGAIKITSNDNSLVLGTDGVLYIPNGIDFPLSNGNNRTGEGNNLQFEKGSAFQKIISTQDGTELVPTVERLVISGGDSYNDGVNDIGEGGDIYLWAGKGANGGDIKVDAGESSTEQGGTVKIRGGYSSGAQGGFVEISSGMGASGSGGDININSGQGVNGNGGFITIQGGYGTIYGGGIAIQAGNGGSAGGNISLVGSAGAWTFKQNGALAFPNGSEQTTAFIGNIIEITYSELVSAINGSDLTQGAYYLITNFRTCYDVPEYYVNGNPKGSNAIEYNQSNVEPIIVLATSTNTISSTAYQPAYPNDRIQYDWTWNTTEITGGAAYGRITERIDEFNNRTDYDHRTILFNRFQSYNKGVQLTGTIGSYNSSIGIVSGNSTLFESEVSLNDVLLFDHQNVLVGFKVVSINSNTELAVVVDPLFGNTINFTGGLIPFYSSTPTGNYNEYKEVYIGQKNEEDWDNFLTFNLNGGSLHNYIGDYSRFYTNEVSSNSGFLLANNVFYGNNIYSNTIGDRSWNNTAKYWFVRNTIAGRFYNNVIHQNGFYSNTIGEYFDNNIIKASMYENTIKQVFEDNEVYSQFYRNLIGDGYNYNTIYSNFFENNIGNSFDNNTIGTNLTIGTFDFRGNTINNIFENNTILNLFRNNKIGNEFKGNLMSDEFELNDIGSFVGGNQFSGGTYNNKFGSYTFDNDFLGGVFSNSCMPGFNNNTIGENFSANNIGFNFGSNVIGENFGYGASAPQGNKIGNNFTHNIIGEYFYNNNIPDNFNYNTIGNYFQWNEINTNIDHTNFTLNYGNITGFTYTSGGTGGATGGYSGLTGSVSGGPGSGAAFDVIVSGGTASSVTLSATGSYGNQYSINDTITILGTSIGGVTGVIDGFSSDAIGKTGSDGTYSNVFANGTGSGENASFDITVTSNLVSDIQLNAGGGGYVLNEPLVIPGSQFGGTGSSDISILVTDIYSDDIVITVTDVTPAPLFYDHYTKQIFERRLGDKRILYYDEDDILNVDSIYVSSGYIPVYSQALTFPINYVTFNFRCDGVYSNDGGSTGQTVNNVQELVTVFNANFRQFGYFFDNNDGTLGLYINPLLKEQYCPTGTYSIYVYVD
jgi:hypothetical protein